MRENRRNTMAQYAYKEIEVYRQLASERGICPASFDWQEEWEKLPLLSKDRIVKRMADLAAPRYLFWENTPRMQSVFTSGTTGVCTEILWLVEDVKLSLMPLWMRRLKRYGISPKDRLCTFYSLTQYAKETDWFRSNDHELLFAKEELNEERLSTIYNTIKTYQVKWMILQPSILQLLYQFMKKNNLSVWDDLAYIELTGEFVSESFYQKMRKWFGISIVNQYGTHEVNTIAYGEGTEYLDIVEENIYVEIVDENGCTLPDGEEGNVCVTCLTNRAMPFVRYLVGDIGKIREYDTNSGKKRQLCLTKARCMELIHLADGTDINPYVLQKAVEVTNHYMEGAILQFRFIQTAYDQIRVELVTEEEYAFDTICRCLEDHIYQEELKGIHFYFYKKEFMFYFNNEEKWGWFYSEV